MQICKHEPCKNIKNAGNGYCKKHYMRMWRGQDLDMESRKDYRPAIIDGDFAKIPLGKNAKDGYAVVDLDNANLDRFKWSLSKRGYVTRGEGKTMHHEILGKPPKGLVTDHINRDRTDNRKENLRFVTYKINNQNTSKQKNNTSGFRGVWLRRDTGKWVANIKVDYKKISLGDFIEKEDAARAYNKAAKQYFGVDAVLNEVEA